MDADDVSLSSFFCRSFAHVSGVVGIVDLQQF